MKNFIIILIIGNCNLLYSQYGEIFVTEPEVNYDLYYKTCDTLRDSIAVFFAERVNYIPEDYEKGVKIFFTAKINGEIKDIEFEEDFENQFNSDLYGFLKSFKFKNPLINYYRGDAFNVRMSITFKYYKTTKYLDIAINHYNYWKEEHFSEENIEIRKVKPQYNKEDTIVFNIINNHETPLYYYITVESRLIGQYNWMEVPVFDQDYSQKANQLTKVGSEKMLSNKLFIKDFYDGADYYHIVVNYGFSRSAINKKVYSYSFDIKIQYD